MSEPSPPLERRDPGWYRDPTDARLHRFWTGHVWVTQDELFPEADQVARVGPPQTRVVRPAPEPDLPGPAESPGRRP